jgi:Ricin-type beta-trefoil lectin domain
MIRHNCTRFIGTMGVLGSIFAGEAVSAQMNLKVTDPNTGVTKCVDVHQDIAGVNDRNGEPLLLWDCVSGRKDSQLWNWQPDGTIRSELADPVTGLHRCIDLHGGGTTDGTVLDLWDCAAGAANEVWALAGAQDANFGRWLTSSAPGECMDLHGAVTPNGTPIDSWRCVDGAWNESWHFSNPLSTVGLTVGATETQTGPNICINGFGFTPNKHVSLEYDYIPFMTAPQVIGTGVTTNSSGGYSVRDTSQDQNLKQFCGSTQLNTSVIVKATDDTTGNVQLAYIPGGLWCSSGPSGFGNGCF